MLLYFKIKNSRSFDKETTFSLISHNRKNKKGNFFQIEKYDLSVLKSMAIYGANASGKSNLLKAMIDGVQIIEKSLLIDRDKNSWQDSPSVSYYPNKNREENWHLPTSYQFGFFIDEVHYELSFSNNGERIVEEKLVKYLPNEINSKVVYLRSFVKGEYVWYFEKEIAENEIIAATKISTNRYTLWLNEVSKILMEKPQSYLLHIRHIFTWFVEDMLYSPNIIMEHDTIVSSLLSMHNDKKIKAKCLKLLKKADFNIEDILIEVSKIEGDKSKVEAYTVRKGKDIHGNTIKIKYDIFREDSTGTQQFIVWLLVWHLTSISPKLLVIDEFGSSMHPLLVGFLLQLFNSNANGQVIYTTHYTELMDRKKISDAQICLVNKDINGNSTLSFLSDYNIPDNVLFDKVYLQGLFGAVPNIDFSINKKK